MKAKPKIFLADLIHNQYGYNYCVPLNIGCLAATLKQKFADSLDLRLFKFPDRLIKALEVLSERNYISPPEKLATKKPTVIHHINPRIFEEAKNGLA